VEADGRQWDEKMAMLMAEDRLRGVNGVFV